MCSHSLRNRNETAERSAQSRLCWPADVFRARLILPLGERQSYREIQRGMRTRAATIHHRTLENPLGQDQLTGLEGRHHAANPEPLRCSASAGGAAGAQKPRDRKVRFHFTPPTAPGWISSSCGLPRSSADVVVCASEIHRDQLMHNSVRLVGGETMLPPPAAAA